MSRRPAASMPSAQATSSPSTTPAPRSATGSCAPATGSCSTPAGAAIWGATTTGPPPASRGRGADAGCPAGEPGRGLDLAGWLAEHRVALTGCDTWSYGPVPPEDPGEPFVVPQTLNIRHGVVVLENLRLAEAAADGLREFCLVVSHAKLRGATGAWITPLALT